MTLEQIFEHGREVAKQLFEKQGELLPMWIAETAEGKLMPLIPPLKDKDDMIEAVRRTFREFDVVRYVSMMEAWAVVTKSRDDIAVYDSLEDHPQRIEVLFIAAEDKIGHSLAGQYLIERKNGKAELSEFERLDNDVSEGRFVGLLATNKTLH